MLQLSVRLIDLYQIGIELIAVCTPEKQFQDYVIIARFLIIVPRLVGGTTGI